METQGTSLARTGLLANAVFSLGCGLLFVFSPATVSSWLGVDIDTWLRLFGVGLISHFAILMWAVKQPAVGKWAKLNLLAIAPYPLLMVVAAGLVEKGQALVLLDGAIVGAFAVMQWAGLRKMSQVPKPQLA